MRKIIHGHGNSSDEEESDSLSELDEGKTQFLPVTFFLPGQLKYVVRKGNYCGLSL